MSKTILLADDSLTIQKVVELTFADTAFEVVSTSSGDELLEKLPGVAPDVIICDTIMPGSDGYSVCQRIKSEPASLHIPVILLTGTFEPFDRDRALAAGCSEIITKPFEARRLVETVERLVSGEDTAAAAAVERDEGAVAPPPAFAGAVQPPAPQLDQAAEFGTLLTEPVPEELPAGVDDDLGEGLDFTTTGFEEMEEAGESYDDSLGHPPDQGLDYEPPAESETFSEPEDVASVEGSGQPEEFEEELGDPFDPFDEAGVGESPVVPPDDGVSDRLEEDDTFVERAPNEAADFGDSPPEDEFDTAEPYADTIADEAPAEEDQDFDFGAAPDEAEEEVGTAPVMPPLQPPPLIEEVPAPATELSDADIDRIARRVVELAADRLEQIAWEVLPDMAEIVVRERLRELEADIDRHTEAPAN